MTERNVFTDAQLEILRAGNVLHPENESEPEHEADPDRTVLSDEEIDQMVRDFGEELAGEIDPEAKEAARQSLLAYIEADKAARRLQLKDDIGESRSDPELLDEERW